MYINLLNIVIKYSNGETIYKLSKLCKSYNQFISKKYIRYVLCKNFSTVSPFYKSVDDIFLLRNAHNYNLKDYTINYCIKKRFTSQDITNYYEYFNDSYIGHVYYIILPYTRIHIIH